MIQKNMTIDDADIFGVRTARDAADLLIIPTSLFRRVNWSKLKKEMPRSDYNGLRSFAGFVEAARIGMYSWIGFAYVNLTHKIYQAINK